MAVLFRFVKDEAGATAVEYGLIVGLIAVGTVAATTALGTDLGDLFNRFSNHLKNSAN
jgi:pilus assembly protein Flp/PilA